MHSRRFYAVNACCLVHAIPVFFFPYISVYTGTYVNETATYQHKKKQVTEVNIMFINRLVPIQISNYKSNKFWNSSKYINIGLSSKPSFLKFIGKKKSLRYNKRNPEHLS